MRTAVTAAVAFVALAGIALAQQDHHHGHGDHPAGEDASTAAFRQANDRMHRDMAIEYSGDANVDFVRGMIPHHQGAIDMARVVLEHGDDPEILALAAQIIAAQEAEIGMMRDWLESRGH